VTPRLAGNPTPRERPAREEADALRARAARLTTRSARSARLMIAEWTGAAAGPVCSLIRHALTGRTSGPEQAIWTSLLLACAVAIWAESIVVMHSSMVTSLIADLRKADADYERLRNALMHKHQPDPSLRDDRDTACNRRMADCLPDAGYDQNSSVAYWSAG
jgi:hypothetical protein